MNFYILIFLQSQKAESREGVIRVKNNKYRLPSALKSYQLSLYTEDTIFMQGKDDICFNVI